MLRSIDFYSRNDQDMPQCCQIVSLKITLHSNLIISTLNFNNNKIIFQNGTFYKWKSAFYR